MKFYPQLPYRPFKQENQPAFGIITEMVNMSAENEFGFDHVKRLENVFRHGQRSMRGKGLVETPRYIIWVRRRRVETVEWLGRNPC